MNAKGVNKIAFIPFVPDPRALYVKQEYVQKVRRRRKWKVSLWRILQLKQWMERREGGWMEESQ